MFPTDLPPPGVLGACGWLLAALLTLGALWARGRGQELRGAGWIVAAAPPAVLGQLGTLLLAASLDDLAPRTSVTTSYALAVAPEAHGYLATGLVASAITLLGAAETRATRTRWAGALGVLAAGCIGLFVGRPSVWLLAVLVVGVVASVRPSPAGLVAVLATWLGARHFLLFAQHHPLIGGDLAGTSELVLARTAALDALMVAGPGTLVAACLSVLVTAQGHRASAPRAAFAGLAVSLGVLGLLGAANTASLAPVRAVLTGGELPAATTGELPRSQARAELSEAPCVAWPEGEGWAVRPRWPSAACDGADRVAVAVAGSAQAAFVGQRAWARGVAVLDMVLEAEGVFPRGPLAALAWRALPVHWVPDPIPDVFALDRMLSEQLEDWLDGQLGVQRGPGDVPGSVWVVDAPQGSMILMTGGAVTVSDPADRRDILARLLQTGDEPRLVLVLGERWTVQDAVDLCADAGQLPCVWVTRAP